MPVQYIVEKIKWPVWAGERYQRLDVLDRFLSGTIYDHLEYPFYKETKDQLDEYIPLRERRPSVRYNIARVVVDRSVGKLFGDKHWPKIHASQPEVTKYLQKIVEKSALQPVMIEAAHVGSIGSVFIFFAIINGKYVYEVWNPKHCRPQMDRFGDLEEVLILSPTQGYELAVSGFAIDEEDMNELFFYAKRITLQEEIIYVPVKCDEYEDEQKSLHEKERHPHKLGFVPGVWIKNFPITCGVDAESTFELILHIYVEIDYQLSQCGRGLKYNSDPQLLIKEPAGDEESGQMDMFPSSSPRVRSTSNALFVDAEGDAKLLEISGQGQKAVLEFVNKLRQYAFEVARGSKKEPDKTYGNMSGRAMEILDEDLIALASVLRVSYGDKGLKPLLIKMLAAAHKLGLQKHDVLADDDFSISFIWGNWFDPTPADLTQTEQALDTAVKGRRLFMAEARWLSAAIWGIGQADSEELEKDWKLPPMPELYEPKKLNSGSPRKSPGVDPERGDGRRQPNGGV